MPSLPARLVALVAAVALAAACSSDEAGGSATTAEPTTTVAPSTAAPTTAAPTTASPTTAAPLDARFEEVVPGGDCQCADGSEFSFWVKEADPAKVLFYFQGGGACFSKETCSFADGTYKVRADGDDPNTLGEGIFDQANDANPFLGWSVVYVPYCTGDVHMGNGEHDYGDGLVIQHRGYVNGLAALDELVARFPSAEQVVVTGESAGGVPTPLFAGLTGDELPDADITAIADSSGAYPELGPLNAAIGGLWGTMNAVPDWPENEGMTVERWSIPGLFVQAGSHDPAITMARHDYAFDIVQAQFSALAGISADNLVALIDQNEAMIEAKGVPVTGYLAPGDAHTVFSQPGFFTEEVAGVKLVDWVQGLVDGDDVGDVRCTDCRAA